MSNLTGYPAFYQVSKHHLKIKDIHWFTVSAYQNQPSSQQNEEFQTTEKYRTLFMPSPCALEVSWDHEKEIPIVIEISKISLLLNKVRSLLGHCVVSMETSNVNGASSIHLTNNTNYIMLFHDVICTHDVSTWLGDLLFERAG